MDSELQKQVTLEQVELIARLTCEAASHERDREIALNLIAKIASSNALRNDRFLVTFALPNCDG